MNTITRFCFRSRTFFGALIVLTLAIDGCGLSSQESKLVGSWQLPFGLITYTFTFSKDHKYIQTTSNDSSAYSSGEWKIVGGKLFITVKENKYITYKTITSNQVGETTTNEIIKLDDSVQILKGNENGEERVSTLTRIK